jgi:capsular polysaccharide biosynthesis protein
VLEKQNQLPEAIALYREALRMREIGEIGGMRGAIAPSAGGFRVPIKIYHSTLEWINSCGINPKNYIVIPQPFSSPYGASALFPASSPSPLSSPHHTPQHPTPNTQHQNCLGLNCPPCLQKILSSFKPVQCTPGVYTCTNQTPASAEAWPTFVATVPNGRAWIAPQQNDWMVCNAIAILTADNTLLADVSRDYPGQLPGCQQHAPSQHRIFSQDLPPLKQVDGTVAVLAGLSGNTYYHWMIDILPRFELLRRSGIHLTEMDWFLVNNNQPGFQQETLDLLDIPTSKILQSDRYPHLQAKQLIVPSFPAHLGWAQPWALAFLRQEFLSKINVETASNYPEKIYISRANANYRRVLNEPDVIEYLDKFGFVAIAPESLSFQAQVALFSQARIIISPHGSGLTNTIFSQPGTTVVELVSPHYIRHYYWQISQQLQLNHYYLPGELFSCYPIRELMYPNPLTEDIWVPMNSLQRLMKFLHLTD